MPLKMHGIRRHNDVLPWSVFIAFCVQVLFSSNHSNGQASPIFQTNFTLNLDSSMGLHNATRDTGLNEDIDVYKMDSITHKIVVLQNRTSLTLKITGVDLNVTSFLIVQAHTQSHSLVISHSKKLADGSYFNGTNPSIIVPTVSGKQIRRKSGEIDGEDAQHFQVYLQNYFEFNVTVLLIVSNYSKYDPIPGGILLPSSKSLIPQPFLSISPNLLTTHVSYIPALPPITSLSMFAPLMQYDVYLTYMYEGDMYENDYWNILIDTSNIQGLKKHAKKVWTEISNETTTSLSNWFISYSGVGAVITVRVSINGSLGALYSASISYGCDFIPGEEFKCTKLVNMLAKLFCASLVFLGGILLFLGHRWLNFTMFVAGFLFTWCFLFVTFVQIPMANIDALGWCTLLGALMGGTVWLVAWHRFKRPFFSALLMLLLNAVFTGMVSTHFLKYAIVPMQQNMAAFVVFPILFAIFIIAYSIKDIKTVHIFSCTFLGSFGVVVPFSFYFGSTLTYIVINVIGLMSVNNYFKAVGYPPFQFCDIMLTCFWVALLVSGTVYQLYRERATPPFSPPSLEWWGALGRAVALLGDRLCPRRQSEASDWDDERISIRDRISATFVSLGRLCSCQGRGHSPTESGYQSFARVSPVHSEPGGGPATGGGPAQAAISALKERAGQWGRDLRACVKFAGRDDRQLIPHNEPEEVAVSPRTPCNTFRSSSPTGK